MKLILPILISCLLFSCENSKSRDQKEANDTVQLDTSGRVKRYEITTQELEKNLANSLEVEAETLCWPLKDVEFNEPEDYTLEIPELFEQNGFLGVKLKFNQGYNYQSPELKQINYCDSPMVGDQVETIVRGVQYKDAEKVFNLPNLKSCALYDKNGFVDQLNFIGVGENNHIMWFHMGMFNLPDVAFDTSSCYIISGKIADSVKIKSHNWTIIRTDVISDPVIDSFKHDKSHLTNYCISFSDSSTGSTYRFSTAHSYETDKTAISIVKNKKQSHWRIHNGNDYGFVMDVMISQLEFNGHPVFTCVFCLPETDVTWNQNIYLDVNGKLIYN